MTETARTETTKEEKLQVSATFHSHRLLLLFTTKSKQTREPVRVCVSVFLRSLAVPGLSQTLNRPVWTETASSLPAPTRTDRCMPSQPSTLHSLHAQVLIAHESRSAADPSAQPAETSTSLKARPTTHAVRKQIIPLTLDGPPDRFPNGFSAELRDAAGERTAPATFKNIPVEWSGVNCWTEAAVTPSQRCGQ